MKIEQFKLECKRTCPSLEGGLAVDLAHMVLGMNTEIVELKHGIEVNDQVNIGEELADYFWYFCNYLTFRNLPLPYTGAQINMVANAEITLESTVAYLYDLTAELQDLVKKFLAYKKDINPVEENHLLELIFLVLIRISMLSEVTISEILAKNIAKLKARYPEKFDESLAINRDLDSERKILEG